MRLHCFTCGKSVSTEVPDETIVRGVIDCPECIESPPLPPELAEENAAIKRDAQKVLEGFVVGVFVRDTARDSDPMWAIKLLPYIAAMGRLQHSLSPPAPEALDAEEDHR